MIPLRDHREPETFPLVNYSLLIADILIFAYSFTLSLPELSEFIATYAAVPFDIIRGNNLYSIFSSMFIHGSLLHLFGNMLFLYVFGTNLEDIFGHISYLAFYLLTGTIAMLLQVFLTADSVVPIVGASGAIAGVLGGYLVLFPRQRVDVIIPIGFILKQATVPAYVMLFFWIVFQLLQGFGAVSLEANGVAYFAHIGGFLAGVFLALFFRPAIVSAQEA